MLSHLPVYVNKCLYYHFFLSNRTRFFFPPSSICDVLRTKNKWISYKEKSIFIFVCEKKGNTFMREAHWSAKVWNRKKNDFMRVNHPKLLSGLSAPPPSDCDVTGFEKKKQEEEIPSPSSGGSRGDVVAPRYSKRKPRAPPARDEM